MKNKEENEVMKTTTSKNPSFRSIFNSTMMNRSRVQSNLVCFCDAPEFQRKNAPNESNEESEKEEIEGMEKTKKSLWEEILDESKEYTDAYEDRLKKSREIITKDHLESPANYLEREIFPILLSAMEETLTKARNLEVLDVQKCRFNGLDSLAEYLWKNNAKWPGRDKQLDVYDIPQFKLCLRLHPRPIFPKSWLWSREDAASRIQRCVRGWLIRKREDVQELRQFWKAIRDEGNIDNSEDSLKSRDFNLCERYKLRAKKREKPF